MGPQENPTWRPKIYSFFRGTIIWEEDILGKQDSFFEQAVPPACDA